MVPCLNMHHGSVLGPPFSTTSKAGGDYGLCPLTMHAVSSLSAMHFLLLCLQHPFYAYFFFLTPLVYRAYALPLTCPGA